MTASQKLIISSAVLALAATLFFIPVTMTLAGHAFDGSRFFWEINHSDAIRFDVLGVWWLVILLVSGGLVAVNGK